jgi:hypothetical protein
MGLKTAFWCNVLAGVAASFFSLFVRGAALKSKMNAAKF